MLQFQGNPLEFLWKSLGYMLKKYSNCCSESMLQDASLGAGNLSLFDASPAAAKVLFRNAAGIREVKSNSLGSTREKSKNLNFTCANKRKNSWQFLIKLTSQPTPLPVKVEIREGVNNKMLGGKKVKKISNSLLGKLFFLQLLQAASSWSLTLEWRALGADTVALGMLRKL